MQVLIAPATRESIAKIDFDRDIPTFPPWYQSRKYMHRRRSEYLFSQVDIIQRTADDLALVNAGRLPLEFSRSATEVYSDFLNDLIVIEGFTGILDSHRYGLSLEVGRLFPIEEVARRAAIVVQQAFYPDEALKISFTSQRSLPERKPHADACETTASQSETES